jgi:hypothetical protein
MNLGAINTNASPAAFWLQLDQRLNEARRKGYSSKHAKRTMEEMTEDGRDSFFPIILLSYNDLLEMSEALLYVHCMHRRDAVLIFAPHFIQEKLLVEMKIALDRWCRADQTHFQRGNRSGNSAHSTSYSSNKDQNSSNISNGCKSSDVISLNASSIITSSIVSMNKEQKSNARVALESNPCHQQLFPALSDSASPIKLDSSSLGMSTAESDVFGLLPTLSISEDNPDVGQSSPLQLPVRLPATLFVTGKQRLGFPSSALSAPPPFTITNTISAHTLSVQHSTPIPRLPVPIFRTIENTGMANSPKATLFVQDLNASTRGVRILPSILPPLNLASRRLDQLQMSPPLPSLSNQPTSLLLSKTEVPTSSAPPLAESLLALGLREEVDSYLSTPRSTASSHQLPPSSAKKNSFRAKERTWVYHALMDVVKRTQADHAVSIVVFI